MMIIAKYTLHHFDLSQHHSNLNDNRFCPIHPLDIDGSISVMTKRLSNKIILA